MPDVWSSGTVIDPDVTGTVTALANAASFEPGDFADSANALYRVIFQEDGNLVLLELPDTVLFASGTNGLGATECIMQVDGNLVIYDSEGPLWASNTAGNEGSTLVLRNTGELAVFASGIEPLAIWSIMPDWRSGMTENLAWLSSVTESPEAVEQRMGLRLSPRQSFEFRYTVWGPRRTYFDLLTMRASGSPAYLPLWHEIEKLTISAAIGATVLSIPTDYTEFQTAKFAYLRGRNDYDGELVEIADYSSSTLTLANPVQNFWPAGTRIFPVKKVRVETHPTADRRADEAMQTAVRFISLEPNLTTAQDTLTQFMDHPVLETDPNEADQLTYGYNRKMTILDNQFGLPELFDVAPFVNQAYSWFAKGRQAHSKVRALFYTLQGRRVPLWISSVFADFELLSDVAADATVMDVKRCGYTDAGGPFKNREYIAIQLYSGIKRYRKITAAALIGDGSRERLSFDEALGLDITPADVHRISFLSFCRLDQDSVELTHHTDTKGLTTVNAVFRTDPGIAGVSNEDQHEIPPIDPGGDPGPVIDPFRFPDQKLFGYAPFGSEGVPEPPEAPPTELPDGTWNFIAWQQIEDEEVVGFPHDLIAIETGNSLFTLPTSGSFRVSVKSYFGSSFGIPHGVGLRINFLNSTLSPLAVSDSSHLIAEGRALSVTQDRVRVLDVVDDPDNPIQIQAEFKPNGWDEDEGLILGMNVFAFANPTNVPGPPYVTGDSFITIEWWP